jgi:hypothetical protein
MKIMTSNNLLKLAFLPNHFYQNLKDKGFNFKGPITHPDYDYPIEQCVIDLSDNQLFIERGYLQDSSSIEILTTLELDKVDWSKIQEICNALKICFSDFTYFNLNIETPSCQNWKIVGSTNNGIEVIQTCETEAEADDILGRNCLYWKVPLLKT